MNQSLSKRIEKFILLFPIAWVLSGACVEFYNIAWGTGIWLGQFSFKWALAFFLFSLFSILFLIGIGIILFSPQKLEPTFTRLSSLRDRLGPVRWILAVIFATAPVYILQYTFWGIILHGPYLRILIAAFSLILSASLFTEVGGRFLSWHGVLTALVLTSGIFVFFVPLAQVTSYPFSLGWSEGNRLWDYSIMFGSHLYEYPEGKSIPVFLDVGRQFMGGIPFLFPKITIWQERLWVALIGVIPYLILGWVVYRLTKKNVLAWALAGIWAFTFVEQGPIHPPLLLCAIVVAVAWGRPLWLAIPLIAGASLFAAVSRFTWIFAPGMWAGMLELSGAVAPDNRLDKNVWRRAVSAGVAGILGGYVVPSLVPAGTRWISAITGQTDAGGGSVGSNLTAASLGAQPLLWYRLFPNETYGPGILIGLILATAPLAAILIHLSRTRHWTLTMWQKLAIILPLLAFLAVGLIVSTKIGGGGDLHNMDMFIIGLMFAGAMAWRNGGFRWIEKIGVAPAWTRFMVLALIIIPGYRSLTQLAPISVEGDVRVIALLADIIPLDPLPDPLPDRLPSNEDTMEALEGIRAEVQRAAPLGDVLFMDQRQLLTFGYITGVPLVPEYDKKVLIDQALSENDTYFEGFYHDLASHRFSLIISNPLHERIKTDAAEFGEENNAWVKWVSTPILCYYEPLYTLKKVTIQILVPRKDISTCNQILP